MLCGPEDWQKATRELLSFYASLEIQMTVQESREAGNVEPDTSIAHQTGTEADMILLDDCDEADHKPKKLKKEQKVIIEASHTPQEVSQVILWLSISCHS